MIFSIYKDEESLRPLLSKKIGDGIEVSNNGSYHVTIPADELNMSIFDQKYYRYALTCIEGDTNQRSPVVKGELTLFNLPTE